MQYTLRSLKNIHSISSRTQILHNCSHGHAILPKLLLLYKCKDTWGLLSALSTFGLNAQGFLIINY